MAALESAKGVLNALDICNASERLFGIALSGGDYTKDLQTRITGTGVELMGARQHMIIAARAAGVQCFDTVYTDLDDMEGFKKDVETIHLMGFDGKSIINPRQIAPVHEIYTPTQKEIVFSQKVVKEIEEKKKLGIGVFTVDGKMIDIAFYDGAKRTIELANEREDVENQAMADMEADGWEVYVPTEEEFTAMQDKFRADVWPQFEELLGSCLLYTSITLPASCSSMAFMASAV